MFDRSIANWPEELEEDLKRVNQTIFNKRQEKSEYVKKLDKINRIKQQMVDENKPIDILERDYVQKFSAEIRIYDSEIEDLLAQSKTLESILEFIE